jgi:hypothetical protein
MNHKSIIILFSIFYFLLSTSLATDGWVQCDPTLPLTSRGSCDLCALLKSFENFVNWLTTISLPLALGFIIYGAIVIMIAGGSEERVKKGKELITKAVTGVIIILTSWLIINTITKVLVNQDPTKPWYEIKC